MKKEFNLSDTIASEHVNIWHIKKLYLDLTEKFINNIIL